MDRPATAREIILEIVRNMREGLEPLHVIIPNGHAPPSAGVAKLADRWFEVIKC